MKTILIVDDVPSVIEVLTVYVKNHTDYKVVVAEDGEIALDIIHQNPPDLILLDIVMPRIGGTALFYDLQKIENTKNIPVIFMSGIITDEVLQKEALDMGAFAYFTKPLDFKALLAKIDSCLENTT